ncbi:pterocarpan synthase 1-like [Phoenix dactylifera]|uniref:Dirigent protein n=1 Tax=Phoenix dactylifera TaxID=42345 RepID=A0A8B9A8F4_PHODC|nr:pterocarpan synthase 1-like [Phoenix dactylifera]
MMTSKIIFFAAVSAATLAVILLAVVSPLPKKSQSTRSRPWLALSLYMQPPHLPNPRREATLHANSAFIFQHKLTEGPKNTSRVIGKARGFIVPIEHSALSAFNIIYLTLDTPEYSGSLSVEAKQVGHGTREELTVVGGTGSFAFARGLAVLSQAEGPSLADAAYHLTLRLRFPGAIPG